MSAERDSKGRRKSLPRDLRVAVLERDGYTCRKCMLFDPSGKAFDIHHIKEVVYGGTDDIDNLDTLCCDCHGEWTFCEPPDVDYETWIAFKMPARWLVKMLTRPWPSDMSAADFKARMLGSFAMLREEQRIATPVPTPPPPRRGRKHER